MKDDKRNKLPGFLARIAGEQGIDADSIIAFGRGDLNAQCAYKDTYLLADKSALHILYMQDAPEPRVFGGYFERRKRRSRFMQQKEAGRTLEKHLQFSYENIQELKVENRISGGAFVLLSGGLESFICAFSGGYMRDNARFAHILNKLIKKEEIAPDDLKEPHEEKRCPKCGMLYPEKDRAVCPRCMDKKSLFLRMLGYFKPYKLRIALFFACVVLETVMNLFVPLLSGTLFYDVVSRNEETLSSLGLPAGEFVLAVVIIALAILVSRLLQSGFTIIKGRIVGHIVPMAVYDIKTGLYNSVQRLSVGFFAKRQTGALMTRISEDANEVMSFFIDGLPYMFTNILFMISSLLIMLSMSVRLTLLSVMTLPLLFFISFKMQPVLWRYNGRRHRTRRSLNSVINDNLTGARVVKAFGREQAENQRFYKISQKVQRAEMDLVNYDNLFYIVYASVEQFAIVSVWLFGAGMVLGDAPVLDYGILVTFISYVTSLAERLDFFSYIFRWWAASMNSAQRIFEILDASPEVVESALPVCLPQVRGEIELKNVSFSYEPNKPVLSNISFKARPGCMLGIVGHSGAGKSTIVNLISRLYDPQEGEVLLDGVNVKELSFAQLHKSIALVSQETYIFRGTVAENIAYARPEAGMREIIEAAAAGSAHDFIMKLPDGYNTVVGERGYNLSGGERQRIAIARAILHDPKILILDEATASLDTQTEKQIQDALDRLIKGRTTIAIAHRLSTLANADRLIVLKKGRVAEIGTHTELLQSKGVYYELVMAQKQTARLRKRETPALAMG